MAKKLKLDYGGGNIQEFPLLTMDIAKVNELSQNKLEVDEVKTNGNIVLKDGSGNKKEYMAATPSGNPMHNLYINAGAVWNSTTGYWELNTLTYITNDQMDLIWKDSSLIAIGNIFKVNSRTIILPTSYKNQSMYVSGAYAFFGSVNIEVIDFSGNNNNDGYYISFSSIRAFCFNNKKLKSIYGGINLGSCTSTFDAFKNCLVLEDVYIYRLNTNISFMYSPNLSKKSILCMIQNATNTTDITITLHPTAKAMADADADIQAAIQANGYIELIS